MTINDCLGYISLKQEEVKKLRARLESLEAENLSLKNQNTVLKYERLLTKAHDAECPKEDAGFDDDQIKISDEDWLKYQLSNREGKIKELEAKIKKLNEEKQQEGDNLKNRIKDLEDEIDQLKSNPTTVSYSELLAIHTADVETINKLNIKARDLNGTISTLLERVSKSNEENRELKKKVQELNDFIQRI